MLHNIKISCKRRKAKRKRNCWNFARRQLSPLHVRAKNTAYTTQCITDLAFWGSRYEFKNIMLWIEPRGPQIIDAFNKLRLRATALTPRHLAWRVRRYVQWRNSLIANHKSHSCRQSVILAMPLDFLPANRSSIYRRQCLSEAHVASVGTAVYYFWFIFGERAEPSA